MFWSQFFSFKCEYECSIKDSSDINFDEWKMGNLYITYLMLTKQKVIRVERWTNLLMHSNGSNDSQLLFTWLSFLTKAVSKVLTAVASCAHFEPTLQGWPLVGICSIILKIFPKMANFWLYRKLVSNTVFHIWILH